MFIIILILIYACKNCRKDLPDTKVEIPNTPLEKLIPTACFTLGSQDYVFRLGGKTFQISDLHQCNNHEFSSYHLYPRIIMDTFEVAGLRIGSKIIFEGKFIFKKDSKFFNCFDD